MQWKKTVFIIEIVMVSSWLLFAVSYGRKENWSSFSKLSKLLFFLSPLLIVFCIAVPIDELFYSPEFNVEKMLFLGNGGYVFNLLLLFYSIFAVINLEAILRNSSGVTMWSIKYMLIGVGGILAINIFYYSYALLYRSLNMNFVSVRAWVLLSSTLIIGFSIFRRRAMDMKIVVSRKVVFRSIALFAVGFYLLGIGLIGQGLRYFGPNVGSNITAFLGILGAVFVLAIILSEKIRRKAIVIINKNFYSQKYDYREQWLQFTKRISLERNFDELLDAIAYGFMGAIRARGATIWLKGQGDGKFHCVKENHFDMGGWEPDQKILEFLKIRKWVINSHDSNCGEIIESCSGLSSEFSDEITILLIVPFFNANDLIGFIVLRDSDENIEYDYEDYDLLKTLASQAAANISNALLSEKLTEAKKMEVMDRVSSFIVHDLKNAASMLSLTTQNAEQHMDNPEFQKDAIRTVVNTTEKIKNIIEKLKILPEKAELHCSSADLGRCVQSEISEIQLNERVSLSYSAVEPVVAEFDKEEIRKVVSNLIINAMDATNGKGEIRIITGIEENMGYVKVSDNGCGMSREFIEKNLFRPFQTTKENGLGIGLYQCKTIIEAHAGVFKVDSKEGRGTDFTFYLPLLSD
jgi:putative PEP-CTERM system histidine kinase